MSTTLKLTPADLDQVRPGDQLIALNGSVLSRPLTVVTGLGPLPGSTTLAIQMTNPDGRPVNLYPDTHVDQHITISRPDPRRATRTINGLRLSSDGAGSWWTSDRRYQIRTGFGGLTECETDHPVRLTPALVNQALRNRDTGWAQPILTALDGGKRGFVCPAGSEHSYDEWEVWDHHTGDYANGGALNHAETFKDAAGDLAAFLARTTED